VQVRFGFVPYNTNVNVGYLLPTAYFNDRWTYQSRRPQTRQEDQWVLMSGYPRSTYRAEQRTNVPYFYCNQAAANQLYTRNETTSGNTRIVIEEIYTTNQNAWTSANGGTCSGQKETKETRYQRQTVTLFSHWIYEPVEHNVSGLKNGSAWKADRNLRLPLGFEGADRTISWDGCIEERRTITGTNFNPIPKQQAIDLDINRVPDSSDSRWGPLLRGAIYTRYDNNGNFTRDQVLATNDRGGYESYSCPTESRLLQRWNDPGAFSTYVNGLQPNGNTYHDIGLLWGARLMSPNGIFAADNAYTPQGGEIERHLIFMTDGDTVTSNFGYSAYGVPWYDRRNVANPGNPGAGFNNEVNARFSALCREVRNLNITLWVISFGSGSNSATETRLEECASQGRYFTARNSAALQQTFRSIADQISALRLIK
ncbi:MAG TPA: hypothetical protein VL973_12815, partial [Sphingomonas sp.]|nr:hypothetical protein [Sphingomonas sp.]